MMFVKLTDTVGDPVCVRATAVNMVGVRAGGEGSLIWLTGDTEALEVKEPLENVMGQIEAAGRRFRR